MKHLRYVTPTSAIFDAIGAALRFDFDADPPETGPDGTPVDAAVWRAALAAHPVNATRHASGLKIGQVIRYDGDVRQALDFVAPTMGGVNAMYGVGAENETLYRDANDRSLLVSLPVLVVFFAQAMRTEDVWTYASLFDDAQDWVTLNLPHPARGVDLWGKGVQNVVFRNARNVNGGEQLWVARAVSFEFSRVKSDGGGAYPGAAVVPHVV